MGLHDVHAHLTDPRLLSRIDEVLAGAAAAGLTTVISNGLHPADNAAVLDLARRFPLVKAAVGLYPVDAVLPELRAAGIPYDHRAEDVVPADQAVAWVAEHAHEAFAIGEIGLDHHWVPEPFWARQEQVFRALLRIARDAGKAVIVHSRKAEARMLEVLREEGVERVDWHCFGGKTKLGMRIAQERGHYLSIPANARRSESFRKLLADLPRDRVLLETDCPYLGPERDVVNEPRTVAGTLALAAELWQVPEERAADQLSDNFEALFGVRP
jgi:TatD DNase family protein